LDAQMAEATPQSGAQIEALKQCLEDDQAGERGELLRPDCGTYSYASP